MNRCKERYLIREGERIDEISDNILTIKRKVSDRKANRKRCRWPKCSNGLASTPGTTGDTGGIATTVTVRGITNCSRDSDSSLPGVANIARCEIRR